MDRSAFLPVERMLMSLCDESIFAVDFFFCGFMFMFYFVSILYESVLTSEDRLVI